MGKYIAEWRMLSFALRPYPPQMAPNQPKLPEDCIETIFGEASSYLQKDEFSNVYVSHYLII